MELSRGLHPLLFSSQSILPCLLLFFIIFLHAPQRVDAYQNYTVGDKLGWFDNLMEPKVNYQKWATGKNFSLGDFLFFNTDKNHSVVQTYNMTTYHRCDDNDADIDDTIEWSAGEPEFNREPVTVAVPLLKEGMTYFFSGNYDGEQCKYGQHFKIKVTHGEGLPESLKSPPEDAPAPSNPNDADSAPDSVIPSNFNNPSDPNAVKATSAAGESLVGMVRSEGGKFGLGLVVVWLLVVFG